MILVKNLPSGVSASELEGLFSPHGSLGRVVLPPAGLTAIVEFLEPTEAKRAFTRLAYSKVREQAWHEVEKKESLSNTCTSPTVSLTHTLSLTHTHTHTLSRSLTYSLSHPLSLPPVPTRTPIFGVGPRRSVHSTCTCVR